MWRASLLVVCWFGFAGCGLDRVAVPGQSTTLCDTQWLPLGIAQHGSCNAQLSMPVSDEQGGVVYSTVINPATLQLSFTATIDETSDPPADGFAVVLGDPASGATVTSLGPRGNNLGANGIPGIAFVFDTFQNTGQAAAPFFGITPSDMEHWEKPMLYTSPVLSVMAAPGKSIAHDYVFTFSANRLIVTMDGKQIFAGNVSLPSTAYLYLTAATGKDYERVTVSNLLAVFDTPHTAATATTP